MTTSIFKPIDFGQLSRIPDRRICHPEIRKVKRVLFQPVDHEATQTFINEELAKISVNESQRWNFDFKRGRTLDPTGNIIWKEVSPQNNRPLKRRPSSEIFDSETLYCEMPEIIRPVPVRPNQKSESPALKVSQTKQTSITDFMNVKKRSTTDALKKVDSNPERPAKKPKLSSIS